MCLCSICRLEWKPRFWKSLSHTHSYSPITVESDFNNPLYEAGVSKTLTLCHLSSLSLPFVPTAKQLFLSEVKAGLFFYNCRTHGSMKSPFEEDCFWVRIKTTEELNSERKKKRVILYKKVSRLLFHLIQ